MVKSAKFFITGIVQGVGFRPFIYNLALKLSLTGWVRNTSGGVEIEIEGTEESINEFYYSIPLEAPPLAVIDHIKMEYIFPKGYTDFKIFHSEASPESFQPISPDISICPDCLSELFDPSDRRYLYPFINCTNCGPRFSIIKDIPYDRINTTMAGFEMCPECKAEYENPLDRRFHAQPIACPVCGPHIWLENNKFDVLCNHYDAIIEAQRLLSQGKIIAIKGLGGFHIACDATNPEAVELLRKRKLRIDKPFAVMVPDISIIREHCLVTDEEAALLESRARPILILERLKSSQIVKQIAPNQNTIGMMLPYTPLHYLLLSNQTGQKSQFPPILVMTSGNLSEEPIAFDNDQAHLQLNSIVDYYIMHNRPIHTRCDDSVMRFIGMNSTANFSRRSRGFAPNPIHVPWNMPQILATGAELKNTFCITRDHYAFVSHHIGDLENYETFTSFEEGIQIFEHIFKLKPEVIAHDLHPNYLSSRYAIERSLQDNCPSVAVQHHHAHIAACMGENQMPSTSKVIGLSFDGTGYGNDGAIWGGEIFIADYKDFNRLYHLKYFKLPGGDAAIRNPARIAVAYLIQSGIDLDARIPSVQSLNNEQISTLQSQISHDINAPLTSSMGRLFDAVTSIIGIRQHINYEAQAAIELEAAIDPDEKSAYSFEVCQDSRDNSTGVVAPDEMFIDPSSVLREVLADYFKGCSVSIISAKFHNGIVNMVLSICSEIRKRYNISEVALSGGVWQNHTLLSKTFACLEENRFHPIIHKSLPPNDGGISLGQAIVAYHRLFL